MLTIKIRALYCRLFDLDISVEGAVFIFLCRPYYLRLNLPGEIRNDFSKCKFDADTGEFTLTYEKVQPGEHFDDLEFVSKFLCEKVIAEEEGSRKIEVLTMEGQKNPETNVNFDNKIEYGYGFAMRGGYALNGVIDEFGDVFKINPLLSTLDERRIVRLKKEKEQFNKEHYLADYVEYEEIEEICNLELPWKNIKVDDVKFTCSELDFLKDLSNVEYNLNSTQIKYCQCNLLEILYAYCYDRRTTYFEGTCESGWTIATISASLSWFDGFKNVRDVVISTYRRSLIYPMCRSFMLCERVRNDLKALLKFKETFIIKCLIEIYRIFTGGDCGRYILNNIYIKDYIVYVMKWNKESWLEIVKEFDDLSIRKCDLGLNLEEVEKLACSDDLIHQFGKLSINKEMSTPDTYDSDDCSSSSSSTSDYSSSSSSSNSTITRQNDT